MPRPDPARFRVIHPGFLTTVQDLGRFGFQRFGMPVAGAMDSVALRLANRLVGNPDNAAALEMTVKGADLIFEGDAVIALTGADLSPMIDRTPAPLWAALEIRRGSTLRFGERRSGARAYLTVAGGIDVPVVLGSRATHLASRTGGFLGRALVKGDRVTCGPRRSEASSMIGRMIPIAARPPYSPRPTLRVVLGPQADCFSAETIETLVRGRYTVSQQADRMGYRLQGPLLAHAGAPDIVSDATPQGSIQVPGNQQPILLMADRQTTGGYPKVGVVITADLPLAAQLVPGDTIGFALIDVSEAQAIARKQRSRINAVLPEW